MGMDWLNLLFLHWPLPCEVLRPLVPAGLEVDTFEGQAWIGLVPFTMRNVRHIGWPPVPTMHHFHECNVRTYVRCGEDAGVWFFSLDAVSRLAVWGARRLWNLPYHHADIDLLREGARTTYALRRRGADGPTLRCVWDAGAALATGKVGSLAHFLTERYALYAQDRRGRLLRGAITHAPWSLQEARLVDLADQLLAAAGIQVPDTPPLAHHAERIVTQAYALTPVEALMRTDASSDGEHA